MTVTFEDTLKNFSQSTKKRLKYYQRYISSSSMQSVRLYGMYKLTDHDANAKYYSGLIRKFERVDDVPSMLGASDAAVQEAPQQHALTLADCNSLQAQHVNRAATGRQLAGADERERCLYDTLLASGYGMFMGGLSHKHYSPAQELMQKYAALQKVQ